MIRIRSTVATAAALSLAALIGVPAAAQTEETAAGEEAVEVTGVDYAYQNLPTSVPAGTNLAFNNAGTELHELAVARIADDTAESLEELMAMGDAALEQGLVELIGETGPLIANPGEAAEGALVLEREGRYVAICFIPQGFVPSTLADLGVTPDMMGPDANPEDLPPEAQAIMANPPHAALGMVQGFTVTAVGTEAGPMPEAEAEAAKPAEEDTAMTGASSGSEVLVAFDPAAGQLSEGVTVDANGNVFASLSPLGQLVKVAAGSNAAEPFGAVEGLMDGDIGLLGLTTDESGDVYGAVFSANPEANGVWRFDAETGAEERVAGTEAIAMPNSVAFGPDGTMYITDTISGGLWSVSEGGSAESWLVDPLLEGNGLAGFPFPIGANGIDVIGDTVYVGVTEQGSIVTVAIGPDGSAGEPTILAQKEGVAVDGIAVGPTGDIYIADPIGNDVVRVDAAGDVDAVGVGGLDGPTSVDLRVDADGNLTLYVASFSVALGTELGAGPSIVTHEIPS